MLNFRFRDGVLDWEDTFKRDEHFPLKALLLMQFFSNHEIKYEGLWLFEHDFNQWDFDNPFLPNFSIKYEDISIDCLVNQLSPYPPSAEFVNILQTIELDDWLAPGSDFSSSPWFMDFRGLITGIHPTTSLESRYPNTLRSSSGWYKPPSWITLLDDGHPETESEDIAVDPTAAWMLYTSKQHTITLVQQPLPDAAEDPPIHAQDIWSPYHMANLQYDDSHPDYTSPVHEAKQKHRTPLLRSGTSLENVAVVGDTDIEGGGTLKRTDPALKLAPDEIPGEGGIGKGQKMEREDGELTQRARTMQLKQKCTTLRRDGSITASKRLEYQFEGTRHHIFILSDYGPAEIDILIRGDVVVWTVAPLRLQPLVRVTNVLKFAYLHMRTPGLKKTGLMRRLETTRRSIHSSMFNRTVLFVDAEKLKCQQQTLPLRATRRRTWPIELDGVRVEGVSLLVHGRV
ncbi:hypothetical protein PENSPDRAFT_733276 [Peniophora sp. CONT]|nr:hypothetical protein PENSPDRAFT_733276 [Peniophora sp. CONT]